MKKIVLVLLVLAIVGGSAFAMDILSYPPPVQGGNILLDLGVGLRGVGYSGAKWHIPPLFAQVEFALPVGVPISVGGMFTISKFGTTWNWSHDEKYEWSWTDITVAGRANWHWGFDINWLDFYTGLSMGYIIEKFNSEPKWTEEEYSYGGFFYAIQVGAHFYFTKLIGVVAEFGYPYWFKAGVALKF